MKNFLPELTEEEDGILKEYLTRHKAPKGSILVELGSTERDLFFLVDGKCEVYQKFVLARQLFALRVGEIPTPAMLGEANLLLGEKRNATIIVSQDMHYYALSHANFLKIKSEHPKLSIKLLEQIGKVACQRFLGMQQTMMDRFLAETPQPTMGLRYLKKFMGNATPCSPELAQKLFHITQPEIKLGPPFDYEEGEKPPAKKE